MPRIHVRIGATIALSIAVSGCNLHEYDSGGSPRPQRQCFWPSSVHNFAVVDSSTLNVRVGRDVFRLDLFGHCPDLSWNARLGLVTTGGSTICVGSSMGTSVVTRGAGRQQRRCPVQRVTALTPEQIMTLPARERP